MATAILALEHGEPLDMAVYCEVMFDKETSGEVPEHREFIYDRMIPWLEGNGIFALRAKDISDKQGFIMLFCLTSQNTALADNPLIGAGFEYGCNRKLCFRYGEVLQWVNLRK